MITTRHTIDDARVVHKEAKSLRDAGHEVILIFPCNDNFEYHRLDGNLLARGISPRGETDYLGMKLVGCPKRSGLIGKFLNFIELGNLAAGFQADVYHAHEPDLSLLIAIRAKRILARRRIPSFIVHDMHEYPPGEPYDRSGRLTRLSVLWGHILWDRVTMHWVDHVFTANAIVRGYALFLKHTLNVDVLYNGPSLNLFPQKERNPWTPDKGKLILCHEGSLPFDRGLREMVEVIDHFRDKVSLRIIGDVFGEERRWLDREIEKRGLKEAIAFTGWLPYNLVGEALKDCHAGLILFRECMENRMAGPPNKLFNYMNAGIPVLSVDFPEMRRIISEEGCGLLIHDQTVGSIERALERVLESPEDLPRMGVAGQKAIRERYSWEQMEHTLLSAYRSFSDKS